MAEFTHRCWSLTRTNPARRVGTFKEGLSATALEQSVEAAKTRVPTPRSLPRRSAHTAPKEAPVKASTSSSTGLDSGLVVSLGPAGGASYTYHFPKGAARWSKKCYANLMLRGGCTHTMI
jgi:hypothetical protein